MADDNDKLIAFNWQASLHIHTHVIEMLAYFPQQIDSHWRWRLRRPMHWNCSLVSSFQFRSAKLSHRWHTNSTRGHAHTKHTVERQNWFEQIIVMCATSIATSVVFSISWKRNNIINSKWIQGDNNICIAQIIIARPESSSDLFSLAPAWSECVVCVLCVKCLTNKRDETNNRKIIGFFFLFLRANVAKNAN